MNFEDLGLSPAVLAAVAEAGYTIPTPIQAQAIPSVLGNRDVLGIAQTGTGKTAGFTLPMIDRLSKGRAKARMPRSLILEPTRELAAQVAESFETYGKNNKLSMALLIGGVSFADQERKLDRGVDVLIATPGRLLDHMERGKVMLNGVQILVVDEADRMLDMGFIPDIERICKRIPVTRQTLFFSATMPPEIQRLTETFLSNPVRIEVAPPASTAATVVQAICKSGPKPADKRDVLRQLIKRETKLTNAIVFCNRKRDVDVVYRSLKKHGFSAAALHGDLDQRVRMATLADFKAGNTMLLIASDVAARGLDLPAVSHVFNFDIPTHAEDYVHRIGRTGRAGREGHAFTIVAPSEKKYLDAIEKLTNQKLAQLDLSSGETSARAPAETPTHSVEGAEEEPKARRRTRRPRKKAEAAKAPAAATETVTDTVTAPKVEVAPAPVLEERPAQPAREAEPAQETKRAPRSRRSAKSEKPSGKPTEGKTTGKRREDQGKRREDQGKRRENQGNNERTLGLGEHVPAFLMRPIPKTATREIKDDDAA